MNKRTFTLDRSGNVIETGRGMAYVRGELNFTRHEMQVICDLCNERGAPEWEPIEVEWMKRVGRPYAYQRVSKEDGAVSPASEHQVRHGLESAVKDVDLALQQIHDGAEIGNCFWIYRLAPTVEVKIESIGLSTPAQQAVESLAAELKAQRPSTRAEAAAIIRRAGFQTHSGGHHVAVFALTGERLALVTGTAADWN
jgi:hypothetical protein